MYANNELRVGLVRQGIHQENDSSPLGQTSSIMPNIRRSWSVDGLRLLAHEVQKCQGGYVFLRVWHPVAHVERADTFQLLDMAICAVASVRDQYELEIPTLAPVVHLIMNWFSDPERVLWHAASRMVRATCTPLLQVFFGIILKRLLGFNTEGSAADASQLVLLRRYINSILLSQTALKNLFSLIGTHYEGVSVRLCFSVSVILSI